MSQDQTLNPPGPKHSSAVLIVDTEFHEYERVQQATEDLDVVLYWARSANEAIEILESARIDLVIADWEIEGLNAVRLASRIKAEPRWRAIHTIVMAEPRRLEEQVRAMEAGADDFLAKPIHPILLRERIRVGLRMRAIQDKNSEYEQRQTILAAAVTFAHKINNPLCAILGNATLIKEELADLDESQLTSILREQIQTIEDEATRIAQVVKQFQDVKKPILKSYMGRAQMIELPGRNE
ncbi:MAG: phosphoserine phosphatase RsbU/P [Candidatus Sumerlaeota bacterium]|nr:phosphoserine phosphatase RsbU/P [Candidatus Sumerlaeota bacterium]